MMYRPPSPARFAIPRFVFNGPVMFRLGQSYERSASTPESAAFPA